MITFQQFTESLDTPAKIVIGPHVQATVKCTFKIGALVYLMDFYDHDKGEAVFFGQPDVPGDSYWGCEFRPSSTTYNEIEKTRDTSRIGAYGILGSGNEFAVFAGAIQTFKAFIAKYHPDCVSFSAEEPSRQRLYRRFTAMAHKALPGYTGLQLDAGVFCVYRKK